MLDACLFDVYRTSSLLSVNINININININTHARTSINSLIIGSSLKCEYSVCEFRGECELGPDGAALPLATGQRTRHIRHRLSRSTSSKTEFQRYCSVQLIERLYSKFFWRAPLLVYPCAEWCAPHRCPLQWHTHTIALLYCTLFVYRTCRIPVEFHADAEALSVCTSLPAIVYVQI